MTDPRPFADSVKPGPFATQGRRTRVGAGWGWMLGYGLLSVVLGVGAFVWPFAATIAATIVIGSFFILAGSVSIVAGIVGRDHQGRSYAIGFGLVSLFIGLIMVFEPATGALSLTLLVAIWLGLRGAMEVWLGAKFRRGRGLMIALGIVNILLAFYVLGTLPWSSLTLPGFILGISFLLGGINAVVGALDHRKGAEAFALPA